MYYAIVAGEAGTQGNAYKFYKFKTENAAVKCAKLDEFSVVFLTEDGLKELCKPEELTGILTAMGVEVNDGYSHETLAKAVFRMAEERATWASEENPEPPVEQESEEMAAAKKSATKKAKAPKEPKAKKEKVAKAPKEAKPKLQRKKIGKFDPKAKIKKLVKDNPARPGTVRHQNLEIVFSSKTVEEAVAALKGTQKGGLVDVKFAIANNLIEVIQPE